MTAWDKEEWAKLVARQERQRRRLLRRTQAGIAQVLDNTDGLERLAAISDEEWARAGEVGDASA